MKKPIKSKVKFCVKDVPKKFLFFLFMVLEIKPRVLCMGSLSMSRYLMSQLSRNYFRMVVICASLRGLVLCADI